MGKMPMPHRPSQQGLFQLSAKVIGNPSESDMATESLRKLEKLILDKIRKRSIEISRNIYQHTRAIKDLAIVETTEPLPFEPGRELPYRPADPGSRDRPDGARGTRTGHAERANCPQLQALPDPHREADGSLAHSVGRQIFDLTRRSNRRQMAYEAKQKHAPAPGPATSRQVSHST